MSLTRNQWIEMWATLKAIEYDMLHFPKCPLSPVVAKAQDEIIKHHLNSIEFIKGQIQSVIGQME
jgi:hypothetical protein